MESTMDKWLVGLIGGRLDGEFIRVKKESTSILIPIGLNGKYYIYSNGYVSIF